MAQLVGIRCERTVGVHAVDIEQLESARAHQSGHPVAAEVTLGVFAANAAVQPVPGWYEDVDPSQRRAPGPHVLGALAAPSEHTPVEPFTDVVASEGRPVGLKRI